MAAEVAPDLQPDAGIGIVAQCGSPEPPVGIGPAGAAGEGHARQLKPPPSSLRDRGSRLRSSGRPDRWLWPQLTQRRTVSIPTPNCAATDRALELGKHTKHLKHRLASRRGRVEALLIQVQIDPERVQFGEQADEVLEAPAQPIDRPRHHHVKPTAGSVTLEPIKLRAPVAALGSRDTVVGVDLDDGVAHALGSGPKLELLRA